MITMIKGFLSLVTICYAFTCLSQTLRPRYIETTTYPASARVARIQGRVTLKVTIDKDGTVQHVELAHPMAYRTQPVLQQSAIDNMRHWKFDRPASAPATLTVIYEYKFDGSLPVNDHCNPITKMEFDLPNRVIVLSNELAVNPSRAKKKNSHFN